MTVIFIQKKIFVVKIQRAERQAIKDISLDFFDFQQNNTSKNTALQNASFTKKQYLCSKTREILKMEYIHSVIKEIKDDFSYLLFLVLLCSAWMGFAPTFYKIITEGDSIVWMERFFILFDNNLLLNIPVCACLLFFSLKLNKSIQCDKQFRIGHIILIIFAQLLLFYKSPLEYAHIWWIFDYRKIYLSLLLFSLFYLKSEERRIKTIVYEIFTVIWICLYNHKIMPFYEDVQQLDLLPAICYMLLWILPIFIYGRFTKKNVTSKIHWTGLFSHGFLPDYSSEIAYSDSISKYAKNIVDRLLVTDLTKESFAVGITSEWGAGKTTFLRLLKQTIGKNADIVEFNPWMCRTPEQLTNDFFSSLSHQLSKKHSSLARNINKYVRKLKSVTIPWSTLFSFKLSDFVSEKSLFERKKELSEKLMQLDKRVVVIIDDVDRLEREEVYEVLRLIRNTADLCNVIYLVAYDKDYVTSVLNEKQNVKDPYMYMEKIFQIEIQLPIVPQDDIFKSFINDLKAQINDKKIDFKFSVEDEKLIKSILSTYRRAKRFARLFSLNYSYLKQRTSILLWQDVFWLDMLQMHNKPIFDTLCYNRKNILRINKEKYFVYSPDCLKDKGVSDEKTDAILTRLWGNTNKVPNSYSIQHVNSFDKYFTLQYQLSKKEIEQLLAKNDYETLERISEEHSVDFTYLWDVVKKKNASDSKSRQQLRSVLKVRLNMCYKASEYAIGRMLSIFKDNSIKMSESDLYTLINSWLVEKLYNSGKHIVLSAIVGGIAENNLLKKSNVQLLIQAIIKNYLSKEKITVYDLLNYDSEINMIIRYLYLRSSGCNYSGQDRRNDAFNYIIDALLHSKKRLLIDKNFTHDKLEKSKPIFIDLYDSNWVNNYNRFKQLIENDTAQPRTYTTA